MLEYAGLQVACVGLQAGSCGSASHLAGCDERCVAAATAAARRSEATHSETSTATSVAGSPPREVLYGETRKDFVPWKVRASYRLATRSTWLSEGAR